MSPEELITGLNPAVAPSLLRPPLAPQGLANGIAGIIGGLGNLAKFPGQVFNAGMQGQNTTTEEMLPWARDIALAGAGAGTAFAPRGALAAGGAKPIQSATPEMQAASAKMFPSGPKLDSALDSWLQKNPGGSITDFAGVAPKVNPPSWQGQSLTAGIEANVKSSIAKMNSLADNVKKRPDSLYRTTPDFAFPTGERGQRAIEGGYTTRAYSGHAPGNAEEYIAMHMATNPNYRVYSSGDPVLASMYARETEVPKLAYSKGTPPVWEKEAANLPEGRPRVQPLLLNTKDYHVVDAGGQNWKAVQPTAKSEAIKLGKPGVTLHNVMDTPSGGAGRPGVKPSTVHITFPEGAGTVRSPFAQFDPQKFGMNDLLGGLAGGGVVAPYILGQPDQRTSP